MYLLGLECLYRDYFKAKVYTLCVEGSLGLGLRGFTDKAFCA